LNPDRLASVEETHLDLFPMGRMDMTAVSVVAANLQVILGLNTRIQPVQPEPEYAFLARRGQYEAGKIIQTLAALPGGAPFKLGLVSVDIYTPILTFVFGESQLGGKAAVISSYRVRSKNQEKAYSRTAKIAVHEVGHLLGIIHCQTMDCSMRFSNSPEKLDDLPLRFCPACEFEARRHMRHLFGKQP
jgi:archaemetzincin